MRQFYGFEETWGSNSTFAQTLLHSQPSNLRAREKDGRGVHLHLIVEVKDTWIFILPPPSPSHAIMICAETPLSFHIMAFLVRSHTNITSFELLVRKYVLVSKNRQLSTETSVAAGIQGSFHLMTHGLK
jgi:hypothetical protein